MKEKQKKYLSPQEVAVLLGLPEVTVQRWIHQGKIPIKTVNKKTALIKSEILNWARAHDLEIKKNHTFEKQSPEKKYSLASSIEKGGIYKNIPAIDIYTAFENCLNLFYFVKNEDKKTVLNELISREELASTGIGNGIAIPHTRSRQEHIVDSTYIPLIFLEHPISFNAIDNNPVSVLFMIFTTNVKEHLKILSKLSFVLQQVEIQTILNEKDPNLQLVDKIKALEI